LATHTTGNIDTSVTRDTQRPWSFVKTCGVAMKFVDDDDDDDACCRWLKIMHTECPAAHSRIM